MAMRKRILEQKSSKTNKTEFIKQRYKPSKSKYSTMAALTQNRCFFALFIWISACLSWSPDVKWKKNWPMRRMWAREWKKIKRSKETTRVYNSHVINRECTKNNIEINSLQYIAGVFSGVQFWSLHFFCHLFYFETFFNYRLVSQSYCTLCFRWYTTQLSATPFGLTLLLFNRTVCVLFAMFDCC